MRRPWWVVSNATSIPTPGLLLYPERIAENLDRMIAWAGAPTRLRPHVKTHKLPQLVAMKRAQGIDKFKAATIAEAEMVAHAGGADILLSSQPVNANFLRYLELLERFPETHFATLVDCPEHFYWMRQQHQRSKTSSPLRLLLDVNVGMDRTGIRLGPEAVSLYQQLCDAARAEAQTLEVLGLHAYDGHLHEPDGQRLRQQAERTFAPVWDFRRRLQSERCPVPLVVASGTPTSPLLATWDADHTAGEVEISAGTTVLWDAGQARVCPDFDFLNAAVLLASVISRPGPELICLDLGHKAVASEFPQPRVQWLGLEQAEPIRQNEEHLVLRTSRADELPVGSLLYGIPYHVCPTVAAHSHAWAVHQGRADECWPVVARDRILTI